MTNDGAVDEAATTRATPASAEDNNNDHRSAQPSRSNKRPWCRRDGRSGGDDDSHHNHTSSSQEGLFDPAGPAPADDNAVVVLRPARIQFGPAWLDTYNRKIERDDIVAVPDMFGKEQNHTSYHDLLSEIDERKGSSGDDNNTGSATATVSLAPREAEQCAAVRTIKKRICRYLKIDEESARVRVVFQKDPTAGEPFQNIEE